MAYNPALSMPLELEYALDCQAWNTLPVAGGLRDQPAGLWNRMKVTLNVYRAAKARNDFHGSLSAFIKQYGNEFQILQRVEEKRRLLRG